MEECNVGCIIIIHPHQYKIVLGYFGYIFQEKDSMAAHFRPSIGILHFW